MFRIQAKNPQELSNAIYQLVGENLAYFDATKKPIDLLETPVQYQRERQGANEFLNVRDVMARGFADCEDLSAWMIAYFLFLKYKARPVLTQTGPHMYHVTLEVLERGEWVHMDPSRLKGMI